MGFTLWRADWQDKAAKEAKEAAKSAVQLLEESCAPHSATRPLPLLRLSPPLLLTHARAGACVSLHRCS